jgi:hypothetical protein
MLFRKRKEKMQYDFEVCAIWPEVVQVIGEINRNGYALVAVTSDSDGWTVFFGRPADG